MTQTDKARYLSNPITNRQRNEIKKIILRCLTEDFDYGKTKNGRTRTIRLASHSIFSNQDGSPTYRGTNLDMVMDKIVLALSFAMDSEDTSDEQR